MAKRKPNLGSVKQAKTMLRAVSLVLAFGSVVLLIAGAWPSGIAFGATAAAIIVPTFVL